MKNKPYVFISYRTEYSREQAETLRGILQAEGIETWKAPEDIPAGEDYLSVFTKAIEECACFAVLMSDAIQEDPGWSRKEIEYAINLEKSARFRIIPVMLDDVPLLIYSTLIFLILREFVPLRFRNRLLWAAEIVCLTVM